MSSTFERLADDLVIRTHGDGIQAWATAALIEHKGRFLLIEKPTGRLGGACIPASPRISVAISR
ncbi:hypothetical protein ACWCQS_18415 [Streptomyces sp. NPDC002076]